MIDLKRDPATFVTEKQLIERIKNELGEKHVKWWRAGWFILCDKTTKNMHFGDGIYLKDFMSRNKYDTLSYVRIRLVADVLNIRSVYGRPFHILVGFKSKTCKRTEIDFDEKWHSFGDAVDIKPRLARQIHNLRRATRYAKRKGGRRYYNDYIHIDCGPTRVWREFRPKKGGLTALGS